VGFTKRPSHDVEGSTSSGRGRLAETFPASPFAAGAQRTASAQKGSSADCSGMGNTTLGSPTAIAHSFSSSKNAAAGAAAAGMVNATAQSPTDRAHSSGSEGCPATAQSPTDSAHSSGCSGMVYATLSIRETLTLITAIQTPTAMAAAAAAVATSGHFRRVEGTVPGSAGQGSPGDVCGGAHVHLSTNPVSEPKTFSK